VNTLISINLTITVVKKCKNDFSTHDIPETDIRNKGMQFNSAEFKSLNASQYDNGKTKAIIKIAKALITKSIEDKTDFSLVLLH
jgi:hypothetical protein